MKTKIIEATQSIKNGFNWGKFMISQFDTEWDHPSRLDRSMSLLRARGWDQFHVMVTDLQTGEGAIFRPGGMARADLEKHKIWVCPLYEPFLEWLYNQDLHDISRLPDLVELPEAPGAMYGYRRGQRKPMILVCPAFQSDFESFIRGEMSKEQAQEYEKHYEDCKVCSDGIEEAFDRQAEVFKEIGDILRRAKDDEKNRQKTV